MTTHVSTLTIDSKAVLHNLNFIKKHLNKQTKILAVVKSNAYGSDAVEMAKILSDHVHYFGVAYTIEGIELREAGIDKPIMVFYPQLESIEQIVKNRLEPSLYNFRIFEAFLSYADKNHLINYPVHIKFNTGLNRLGFWHTDLGKIIADYKTSNNIVIKSVYSHLAASEDPNEVEFTTNQINSFEYIIQQFFKHLNDKPMAHILNTSGVFNYPQAQFDMVRVGIGLYGFGNDPKITSQLQNTHHLSSIITQLHILKAGDTVGYNRAFTANKETKVAVIPIGHADGISRKLGHKKGFVIINNTAVPIIGNVCMDIIMVDVTNIDCKEGDMVTLFNHQDHVNHIANICDTINYEVITQISRRVKKVVL